MNKSEKFTGDFRFYLWCLCGLLLLQGRDEEGGLNVNVMMMVVVMMMMVTQHVPTSHIPTRWESVLMMKGGNMTQSISHHIHI